MYKIPSFETKEEKKLKEVISMLKTSIPAKDKKQMLTAFELAENIDFGWVCNDLFDEYDVLVSDANDILLS